MSALLKNEERDDVLQLRACDTLVLRSLQEVVRDPLVT